MNKIIAVYRDDDNQPTAQTFLPEAYAIWAELGVDIGDLPRDIRFYALTAGNELVQLGYKCDVGRYDEDDFAVVTRTWTLPDGTVYAAADAARDGRA